VTLGCCIQKCAPSKCSQFPLQPGCKLPRRSRYRWHASCVVCMPSGADKTAVISTAWCVIPTTYICQRSPFAERQCTGHPSTFRRFAIFEYFWTQRCPSSKGAFSLRTSTQVDARRRTSMHAVRKRLNASPYDGSALSAAVIVCDAAGQPYDDTSIQESKLTRRAWLSLFVCPVGLLQFTSVVLPDGTKLNTR
jgi:hypothetical protein